MVLYRLLQKLVNESESVQKECLQNGSLSMIEVHNPIIDFDTKQLHVFISESSFFSNAKQGFGLHNYGTNVDSLNMQIEEQMKWMITHMLECICQR